MISRELRFVFRGGKSIISTTINGGKAAVRSKQTSLPDRAWRARSGRIQAPQQQLLHGRNQLIRRAWRRLQSSELLAERNVAIQSFLPSNPLLRPQHLVLHRLRAQPADPPTLVPFPNLGYVRLRALLRQSTALASREHFAHLRCRLSFCCCRRLFPHHLLRHFSDYSISTSST
nr:hypothetical protein PanWU01x14_059620 [Ipomoea batatas]